MDRTRTTNEAVAEHCATAPHRLAGLYAVKSLGLKGVSASMNVGGRAVAHPYFDPVWQAAPEFGAVVFIHPGL